MNYGTIHPSLAVICNLNMKIISILLSNISAENCMWHFRKYDIYLRVSRIRIFARVHINSRSWMHRGVGLWIITIYRVLIVMRTCSTVRAERALTLTLSLSIPLSVSFSLMNLDLSTAGHGGSFVAAQCRSMPASCSAWWGASETPRRSASIASICLAGQQSLVRRRRRRRRRRDRRRSTGSTELDTSDRWARGGMGARRWAHLPGCRGPSRLPRPPPPRPPPLSASSQSSVVSVASRMLYSCRMRINRHRRPRSRRRAPPEPPALPPSRQPRRGPSDGVASRRPTGPSGRSSAWPSRTLLGRCASASWSGSILCERD